MWTPDFLLHAISTLGKMLPLALVKKEYEAKRVIHTLMEYLLMVQKQLLSQKKELGKSSMRNLVESLLSLESSTTFTETTVTMETSSWILNSYAENFQGPSCSSRSMATTTSLSMTAVIPTTLVDVHSTMSSQTSKSIEDMLEESFTLESSYIIF
uniref:Uncharacterized protein n=1 Tax=Bactrocera dorsalis TaxID=27457 RepID=A0A034UX46_BACDO